RVGFHRGASRSGEAPAWQWLRPASISVNKKDGCRGAVARRGIRSSCEDWLRYEDRPPAHGAGLEVVERLDALFEGVLLGFDGDLSELGEFDHLALVGAGAAVGAAHVDAPRQGR